VGGAEPLGPLVASSPVMMDFRNCSKRSVGALGVCGITKPAGLVAGSAEEEVGVDDRHLVFFLSCSKSACFSAGVLAWVLK